MKRITRQIKYLNTPDYLELFQKMIRDSGKGNRVKKDGKRIRTSTIDTYIYILKLLREFTNDTAFELRLYISTNLNAAEKEQARKYNKKFFTAFTNYLYHEKDYFDNYVGLIIKGLRTFYNYLNTELNISVGEYHKQFYAPSEEIPIVVLSPEQLNYLIYDAELNERLPEHLHKVKDIFIFGCTVALRYSDLMQLHSNNLQYYNGAHYLKVTSLKTSTHTTIKLPGYAIELLQKYHKKNGSLLPSHSNAWLNKCLKELARYLDFKEPMIKYRTKRGVKHAVYKNKAKKQHYTMADHITTHTMRRTAITTMLRLGVPDQVVRKISGHAANSKEFFRYVAYAQNYIDEHTDMVFEKITNMEPAKKSLV